MASRDTVSASDMRDNFAEILDQVETRRVLVQKHGQERAYLISVRELRALEESLAIIENTDLARDIQKGLEEARKAVLPEWAEDESGAKISAGT